MVDEVLYCKLKEVKGKEFVGISLRLGMLMEENEGGVEIGKMKNVKGNVGRKKVVKVVDEFLVVNGVKNSWIDLYEGDEDI